MRTRDEATDPNDRKVIEDIASFGWHVILVPEDDEGPAFAYTVGLFGTLMHPELVMFGLPTDDMRDLLNYLGEEIRGGRTFTVGERVPVFDGDAPCTFALVLPGHYEEYLSVARWYYRSDEFPALQVLWPDRKHRFPTDPACDAEVRVAQPLLDRGAPAAGETNDEER